MPCWEDVVRIGGTLPEVEEASWYGSPSLLIEARDEGSA